MPQNYKQMTEEQFNDLMERVEEGCMGEEFVYACTASPHDHIHLRRIGEVKSGEQARLGVFVHGPTGMVTLFLSASDARGIAETLLSIAEDIDGDSVSFAVPDDFTALMDSLNESDDDEDA